MSFNINKLKALWKRGIFKLILNRLLLRASYLVPWNSCYRPNGVLDINTESPDVVVDIIHSDIVTTSLVPKAFFELMLQKFYDKTTVVGDYVEMQSVEETFRVAKLSEGRVYSDNLKTTAVITAGNLLLSEVSFQYVAGESTTEQNSSIFDQKFFRKPDRIDGSVFVMLAGGLSGRGNYYHWLIDVLPRLYLLQQSRFAQEVDKYLVPQYSSDFQKTSLRLMGVSEDQIIECDSFTHLSCRDLVVSSHPRGRKSLQVPDWVFDFYSDFKLKLLDSRKKRHKRIYITRKDSKLRGVYQEDRLIDYLKPHGFEAITLSEHDFDAKVNIFDAAEYIICAHGAGLTNLLFANKGCKLLEFFSEGFVNPLFMNLAEHRQVEYHYLIFDNKDAAHEDARGQYEDVFIDYDKMELTLNRMLE